MMCEGQACEYFGWVKILMGKDTLTQVLGTCLHKGAVKLVVHQYTFDGGQQ